MRNIATLGIVTLGMILVSGAAVAGANPVSVPEPLSVSLLAGGIVAIAAIKGMRRK